MKYAQWSSFSRNIGEEIQRIAVLRFIPHSDLIIDKHHFCEIPTGESYKMILNGYHGRRIRRFAPPDNLDSLLISIYFSPKAYKEIEKGFLRDYLIQHGPVGCRDTSTLHFMESIGVPAYFSGCLTLTLERNPEIMPNGRVFCVGLNSKEVDFVRQHTTHPVVVSNRLLPMIYSDDTRLDIAKAFLALYQGAHCVVTNCIHVALPCLALGTPVLFMGYENVFEPERLSGLLDFFHHASREQIDSGHIEYDFDNPPVNPDTYVSFREDLIRRCSAFTGHNSNESLLTITDPWAYLVGVFSTSTYYQRYNWRELYYMTKIKIIRHSIRILLSKKTLDDLRYRDDENPSRRPFEAARRD